ncbi:MAG: transcriptional repressor [Immundisolibacteraceae bacterium]|nr:transcriptional repressor [Immundisolibacteraceae bacterium]
MTDQSLPDETPESFQVDPFGTKPHNHNHCRTEALMTAERICADQGARLTPLRRQVLALVWNSHTPVKAYDLLNQLQKDHPNAAPTTVYRALDFLLERRLIHRLQSLNAFIGCGVPGDLHQGQFLICRVCGAVAELPLNQRNEQIDRRADQLGFQIEVETIEITGVCSHCQTLSN